MSGVHQNCRGGYTPIDSSVVVGASKGDAAASVSVHLPPLELTFTTAIPAIGPYSDRYSTEPVPVLSSVTGLAMNCQSSGKPRSLAEVQPRETFPVVALKNAAVTLPTFVLAMYRRDWSGLRKMLVELPAAPTS